MRTIASRPSSGRLPCAARPRVTISSQAKPLWPIATARSVGSVTIAASARQLADQRLGAEALVLLVDDGGDDEPAARPRSAPARPAAAIIAATPPFMSCAPRPYSRPSLDRAARTDRPCPRRRRCRGGRRTSRDGPGSRPSSTPMTFGRPGRTSSHHHVESRRAPSPRARPRPPPLRPARRARATGSRSWRRPGREDGRGSMARIQLDSATSLSECKSRRSASQTMIDVPIDRPRRRDHGRVGRHRARDGGACSPQEGAAVVAVGAARRSADELAAAITGRGGRALAVPGDVTQRSRHGARSSRAPSRRSASST